MTTITEQNKLIAEFMGWKETGKDLLFNSSIKGTSNNTLFKGWIKKDQPYTEGEPLIVVDGNRSTGIEYLRRLEYHTSWDWLMPVVDKIHSLGWLPTLTFGGRYRSYSRTVFHNPNNRELFDRESETMIEATYKAVVQFIQWYNENKPT